MQTAKLGLLVGFAMAALMGCSSSSSPPINTLPQAGNSNGTAGANSGTAGAGGSVNGSAGQTATAGGPAATGGAPGTGGAPAAAGASGNAATAGAAGTPGGAGAASVLSEGCGTDLAAMKDQAGAAFTFPKGKWVEIASQPNPKGEGGITPPPMKVPCQAADDKETTGLGSAYPPCGADGTKKRGFWVYVPANFDNTKPSKVIYEAAGCADKSAAQGGTASYQYQNVDQNSAMQVIQVGMEYSRSDYCYDNQQPTSNDFKFFPLLHQWVEKNFCVDKSKQYFSGYSTGAWVANQFTCAFPDVLHGFVFATGSEPQQPTCLQGHPSAGLFLHDINDGANKFNTVLPGCVRLLTQNGCTVKTCDTQTFSNPALVTKYDVSPAFAATPSISCVSFNGCPANAPVVFCTTNMNDGNYNHYLGNADPGWITKLFWDFIDKH